MGYRGKVVERQQARQLRRTGLPPWARSPSASGCPRAPCPCGPGRGARRAGGAGGPGPAAGSQRLAAAQAGEIERLLEEGRARIGRLSEREFLVAGVALYAGEGSKGDGRLRFVNSDPRMVVFFGAWLRHFHEIDESGLRLALYLHQGLDLAAAMAYWSALTGIPDTQFTRPYRAVPDPSIRHTKHVHGCVAVGYSCSATHRSVMGLVRALLSDGANPG